MLEMQKPRQMDGGAFSSAVAGQAIMRRKAMRAAVGSNAGGVAAVGRDGHLCSFPIQSRHRKENRDAGRSPLNALCAQNRAMVIICLSYPCHREAVLPVYAQFASSPQSATQGSV